MSKTTDNQSHHLRLRLRSQVVIPARLASTRLPQKLLLNQTGKSVIQHTYEAASKATRPLKTTVAVDSQELAQEVARFGGDFFLTDPKLPSGTDRVVAVAKQTPDCDVFVNVQGDEPELPAEAIDRVIGMLEENPSADVATLATPIRERSRLEDPSCVKVVLGGDGSALYFSRSPIPHVREWNDELLAADKPIFLQHLGIYAYRRDFLLRLEEMPASPLEQLEKLEQLRFLEAGHCIAVDTFQHAAKGIDTLPDYEAFVARRLAA